MLALLGLVKPFVCMMPNVIPHIIYGRALLTLELVLSFLFFQRQRFTLLLEQEEYQEAESCYKEGANDCRVPIPYFDCAS
ncbi:hypothetical protein KSX_28330 [Ktedonospora formicarum]|uniref:Uncharacterized protein n=1 Tax=Ktedonospora formicarum TaxID=2778364 RepID=A0A8J3I0Q9_9CHLR|nr:hypothetical protein KSX_28330 [Ktedonospora formicarum]